MKTELFGKLDDACDSMLRSDYIPIKDYPKLLQLADYFVDYFGYLRQIVSPTDHLIVGRRGTGKTTLLYRALVECINSWRFDRKSHAKPRTLGVYVDLSRCQALNDRRASNYDEFEHVFASELYEAIREELQRTWPDLQREPSIIARIFDPDESNRRRHTTGALKKLSEILSKGVLREEKHGKKLVKSGNEKTKERKSSLGAKAEIPSLSASADSSERDLTRTESELEIDSTFRLAISDVLRALGEIRTAAQVSHIVLLIDELSSLRPELQRRFTTLARKILGNHVGVSLKVCAITDNYYLGSSIILQRDLFELSLDLDAYVERSGSLNSAMDGLRALTEQLVTERIRVYANALPDDVFDDPAWCWDELSKSAMGVPRTLGIALKQALHRNGPTLNSKMRKADIEYGIQYASKAYLKQFYGACGVAIPAFYRDIWESLLRRAQKEQGKVSDSPASHFLLFPKNEQRLKYLSMFFLVHLLTQSRTTKKDRSSRSLYVFDYGVCSDLNLRYGTDKNYLRQQRFAYDDEMARFDSHFSDTSEPQYVRPKCGAIYRESQIIVAGSLLNFCPRDKEDLERYLGGDSSEAYTEEEIKIIGAISSAEEDDHLIARQVADDVGCYVQKVSKFGEKLERDRVIGISKIDSLRRNVYFRRRA